MGVGGDALVVQLEDKNRSVTNQSHEKKKLKF